MTTFLTALIMALMTLISSGHATHEAQAQAPTQVQAEVQDAGSYVAPFQLSPEAWAEATLSRHGVTLRTDVELYMTNDYNCGAAISPVQLGGCTYTTADDRTVIVVSPQLANTLEGDHILMHEVGHSAGLTDECMAEDFAHYYTHAYDLWSYPQCAERFTH